MTNVEWAKKLGVGEKTVALMGGAAQLEAMTELGLEILLAVWLRPPTSAASRAAGARIGRESSEELKRVREADKLRDRREYLLRRMRGVTAGLVWDGPPMPAARAEVAVEQKRGPAMAAAADWNRPKSAGYEPKCHVERMLWLAERVS